MVGATYEGQAGQQQRQVHLDPSAHHTTDIHKKGVGISIGVYGAEADFQNYRVTNPSLQARIELAAERAAPFLRHRAVLARPELAAA